MENNFKKDWFKVFIILILAWFSYSYIQNMKYNSYVECNSKIMINNHIKDNTSAMGEWYGLCDISLNHKLNGMWMLP